MPTDVWQQLRQVRLLDDNLLARSIASHDRFHWSLQAAEPVGEEFAFLHAKCQSHPAAIREKVGQHGHGRAINSLEEASGTAPIHQLFADESELEFRGDSIC